MLPSGYLIQYEVTAQGTTIRIQSPINANKIFRYHFPNTKAGEQMLRRYLNTITQRFTGKIFSSKMTNPQVMDAIIMANQLRGYIE